MATWWPGSQRAATPVTTSTTNKTLQANEEEELLRPSMLRLSASVRIGIMVFAAVMWCIYSRVLILLPWWVLATYVVGIFTYTAYRRDKDLRDYGCKLYIRASAVAIYAAAAIIPFVAISKHWSPIVYNAVVQPASTLVDTASIYCTWEVTYNDHYILAVLRVYFAISLLCVNAIYLHWSTLIAMVARFGLALWNGLRTGSTDWQTTSMLLFLSSIAVVVVSWRRILDYLDTVELRLLTRYDEKCHQRVKAATERAAPADVYQYRELNHDHIRVLTIEPGNLINSAVFRARLTHVPVDGNPCYEAISYHWGSADLTETIIVDGCIMRISESALRVLRARRLLFDERPVWSDAICIDQTNEHEKTRQVQLMEWIYRQAVRTIAFPGKGPDLFLAEALLYEENRLKRWGLSQSNAWADRPMPRRTARWLAYRNFFRSEYFKRTWIIQELGLARKAYICLHRTVIPWHIFSRAVARFDDMKCIELDCLDGSLMQHIDQRDSVGAALIRIVCMSLLRMGESSLGDMKRLDNLLELTNTAKATDPRDKVFGIVGITAKFMIPLLKPDYSKPIASVYENAARYLFVEQEKPSLMLLTQAGVASRQKQQQQQHQYTLPSWVPDLAATPAYGRMWQFTTQNSRDYRACGNFLTPSTSIGTDGSLHIKGVMCDKIVDICPFDADTNAAPPQNLLERITFHHQARRFVGPKHEADLCRILVAGYVGDTKITPEWRSVYAAAIVSQYALLPKLLYHTVEDQMEELLQGYEMPDMKTPESFAENVAKITNYNLIFVKTCAGRRLAKTSDGRICLVPGAAAVGDRIFIPHGSLVPLVVRGQLHGGDEVVLVGDAYVDGLMNGEAMVGQYTTGELSIK